MYIDGVFSGGGVKGFALIGAYEAIEKRGFKFKRIAGTSVGSLVAGFIAAGYTSKEIFSIVDELQLETFLDARHSFVPSQLAKWLSLYWKMGLYKGDRLEEWIAEKLSAKGVVTFGDLPNDAFKVIVSDLTNSSLIVIPDDLPSYNMNPEKFSVAKAIRMSSSLPYFFEPVKLKVGKNKNIIVDGGVLSNFPMWLFEKEKGKKERPVLGVKLSPDIYERPKNKIKNGIDLFSALFVTMKEAHDSRYISRKHEKNIIFIPVKDVVTTEFDLSDHKKQKLFQFGFERADAFLKSWHF